MMGLGTACMNDEVCSNAVANALNNGYKMLDTALHYKNQKAVGQGIIQSGLQRDKVWVTTKVSFFPDGAKEEQVFQFNPDN